MVIPMDLSTLLANPGAQNLATAMLSDAWTPPDPPPCPATPPHPAHPLFPLPPPPPPSPPLPTLSPSYDPSPSLPPPPPHPRHHPFPPPPPPRLPSTIASSEKQQNGAETTEPGDPGDTGWTRTRRSVSSTFLGEGAADGRVDVVGLAEELGRHHRDHPPGPDGAGARRSVRRVHGGAIPVERLGFEPGVGGAGRGHDRGEGAHRQGRARRAARRRARSSSTRAPRPAASFEILPM